MFLTEKEVKKLGKQILKLRKKERKANTLQEIKEYRYFIERKKNKISEHASVNLNQSLISSILSI